MLTFSVCVFFFSFFLAANLSNAVCSEELGCQFKELDKGSGVYLISGSLIVKGAGLQKDKGEKGFLCCCSLLAWHKTGKPYGKQDGDLEPKANLIYSLASGASHLSL